jgi:integrase
MNPIGLHEARHSFASLLIDAGTSPKAIQTFLGHASISITFDVYGHLMLGSRDEVRERMEEYLASCATSAPVNGSAERFSAASADPENAGIFDSQAL